MFLQDYTNKIEVVWSFYAKIIKGLQFQKKENGKRKKSAASPGSSQPTQQSRPISLSLEKKVLWLTSGARCQRHPHA